MLGSFSFFTTTYFAHLLTAVPPPLRRQKRRGLISASLLDVCRIPQAIVSFYILQHYTLHAILSASSLLTNSCSHASLVGRSPFVENSLLFNVWCVSWSTVRIVHAWSSCIQLGPSTTSHGRLCARWTTVFSIRLHRQSKVEL